MLPELEYFDADSNLFTSLDFSANPKLERLYVYNNRLTSLDLSANDLLRRLKTYGNPLTSIKADIKGGEIVLGVNGSGTLDLNCYELDDGPIGFYAIAVPDDGAAFADWTSGGAQAGTTAQYDLTEGEDYTLTANFEDDRIPNPETGGGSPLWWIAVAAVVAAAAMLLLHRRGTA